jgi:hypothetical protein
MDLTNLSLSRGFASTGPRTNWRTSYRITERTRVYQKYRPQCNGALGALAVGHSTADLGDVKKAPLRDIYIPQKALPLIELVLKNRLFSTFFNALVFIVQKSCTFAT